MSHRHQTTHIQKARMRFLLLLHSAAAFLRFANTKYGECTSVNESLECRGGVDSELKARIYEEEVESKEEEVLFDHDSVPSKPNIVSFNPSPKYGLIMMDCFCPFHGTYLIDAALNLYGVAIIDVLSGYIAEGLYRGDGIEEHLPSRIPNIGKEEEWMKDVTFQILGVHCESDAGLPSAERLGVALGLHPDRHHGKNRARRDKFLMNAAASKHGLLTVLQSMCATLEEAVLFATELGVTNEVGNDGKRCVLKPVRGVASDGVFLCQSLSDVRDAYEQIRGKAVYGSPTEKYEQVLVQEFAIGTEYAVDIVSKAGEHKVAALWKYDKRPVNDAPFVYHGTMLANTSAEEGRAACEYAMAALDAVEVKWGLSVRYLRCHRFYGSCMIVTTQFIIWLYFYSMLK